MLHTRGSLLFITPSGTNRNQEMSVLSGCVTLCVFGIKPPMTVKAVAFVAKSGTGKTTLLEKVIRLLKDRGYKVGAIKHDAHRFDIDHPGKDSHRLTAAGADTMVISSSDQLALVKKHPAPPPVEELLEAFFTDVDIVLTEGFKSSALPKIEVHRRTRSAALLCRGEERDPMLLAVASDEPLELDVPLLDIDDPGRVADFIEERFLK
jgi:molybdopterin-guanine dinucleotide biosynthesis protein MobB